MPSHTSAKAAPSRAEREAEALRRNLALRKRQKEKLKGPPGDCPRPHPGKDIGEF